MVPASNVAPPTLNLVFAGAERIPSPRDRAGPVGGRIVKILDREAGEPLTTFRDFACTEAASS